MDKDFGGFTECSVDTMLKTFLQDSVDNKSASLNVDSLFDRLLDAMVRISNGDFQHHLSEVKASAIRDHLKAYSQNSRLRKCEEALHSEFMRLVNTALLSPSLQLVDSEVPEIRPYPRSPICFHVNDPSYLAQKHQGQLSQRKPDVVIVSQTDENIISKADKGLLLKVDIFTRAAIKSPSAGLHETCSSDNKSFEWRTVRAFVEFTTYKGKTEAPPRSHTRQPKAYQPPPKHRHLPADGLMEEPDAPGSEALSLPPAASTAGSRESPSETGKYLFMYSGTIVTFVLVRRSQRHLELSAAEIAQSGTNSRQGSSEGVESEDKRPKTDSKRRHPVIVQAGGYAGEMFAADVGRQHVVGLIIVDDPVYIWSCNGQCAIPCSALNSIKDLPRFMLLLGMQRFQNHNWGLNLDMVPTFGLSPWPLSMNFDDHHRKIEIKLELSSDECKKHIGLNGRATNDFPVLTTACPSEDGLIAKVFWVEESYDSEPAILKGVYEIAQKNEMVCDMVYEGTSTKLIRQRLVINADHGPRIRNVIVFEKLKPITELVGDVFLHAWWETINGHLALWKSGVRHRDISPYNLMYRMVDGKVVGVLNDFDLASLGDGVTGTERTGTVPFMAVNLLTDKALAGETEHLYEHDAESFIWVLTWIALRYDDGKFSRERNPKMDKWLTMGASTCRDRRTTFVTTSEWKDCKCGHGHERSFQVAGACLKPLALHIVLDEILEVDVAFEKLLKGPVEPFLFPKN